MPILLTQAAFRSRVVFHCSLLCLAAMLLSCRPALAEKPATIIRSARSGRWSAATTWEGGKVPTAGARVQIRSGHRVEYDVKSDQVIRSIHVAGTLTFARDRDTRLDVGLIKIQPGDDAGEDGFDCDAHVPASGPAAAKPALEVGTPDRPMPAGHTALIRLTYVEGLDRKSCPAIVCCGGRMDFHGAAMSRTWVKLGDTASPPRGAPIASTAHSAKCGPSRPSTAFGSRSIGRWSTSISAAATIAARLPT
jgi:hypothetical protein